MDSKLGGVNGEDMAKELYWEGFSNITLAGFFILFCSPSLSQPEGPLRCWHIYCSALCVADLPYQEDYAALAVKEGSMCAYGIDLCPAPATVQAEKQR